MFYAVGAARISRIYDAAARLTNGESSIPVGRQSLPIGSTAPNSPRKRSRNPYEVRAEGFVFQLRYGLTVKSQASWPCNVDSNSTIAYTGKANEHLER